ncbi:MAG: PIG-L deacetylase family protein, partial [Candidatus Bathyarchaeia archaeon]
MVRLTRLVLNVLAVLAHCCDLSRCAGALINYSREGHRVYVLSLTYGESIESPACWAQEGMTIEKAKVQKRAEADEACKLIGVVENRNLDWGDCSLTVDENRFLVLVDEIRRIQPDIILTHPVEDRTYWDHRVTAESVIKATHFARSKHLKTRHEPLMRGASIYMFEPIRGGSEALDYKPDIYIDITEAQELKVRVCKCFKSHFVNSVLGEDLSKYFADFGARWRGVQSGTWY